MPSNRLSNNGAEQPVADTRLNVVPATPASPSTPHQPSEEEEEPNEEPESPMSEELREHIQVSQQDLLPACQSRAIRLRAFCT